MQTKTLEVVRPILLLPTSAVERNHSPKTAKKWSAYRECLRWDFGFVCPYCHCHEADYIPAWSSDAAGHAVIKIEHPTPRSQDTSDENASRYSNIVYACATCNTKKTVKAYKDGKNLLDPTVAAWADHFSISDDTLVPYTSAENEGDTPGEETEDAYRINVREAKGRREYRRVNIQAWIYGIKGHEAAGEMREEARVQGTDSHLRAKLLKGATFAEGLALESVAGLIHFAAIPYGAQTLDDGCRCDPGSFSDGLATVPQYLREGVVKVEVPVVLFGRAREGRPWLSPRIDAILATSE